MLTISVNWLINPFSLYGSPIFSNLNSDKIDFLKYLRLTKIYDVIVQKPDTIIVGTSRSGRGLSSQHSAWAGSSVYNLALPGITMYEALRVIQHAHASHSLRRVVLGLDFRMFNVSNVHTSFSEDRLLVDRNGQRNSGYLHARLSDLIATLLSGDALEASLRTIRYQGWTADMLFPDGRWDRIRPGYDHAKAFEFFHRESNARLSEVGGELTGLDQLRALIRFAHREHIDLNMLVSPSHGMHWLLIDELGLLNRFEDLRRVLVNINDQEALLAKSAPFPILDFSGINAYSNEPVPNEDSNNSSMRWFWDPVHYKKEVGDIILQQILENPVSSGAVPEFGVQLSASMLEEHFTAQRRALAKFRASLHLPD